MYRNDDRWRRASAGLVSIAAQVALGALLIYGLPSQGERRQREQAALTTIDLPTSVPPEQPKPRPSEAAAAAPAGRTATPSPVEAPPAAVAIAPTPAPTVAGPGLDSSKGSADAGSGPGAGGAGSGSGAGGNGNGSGGIASPARRLSGALLDSDYPRDLEARRIGGTVRIGFRVRTDGRTEGCTVVQSSGNARLDDLTCRLFAQRFRFRPAMTAQGQPLVSTLQTTFTWGTRGR